MRRLPTLIAVLALLGLLAAPLAQAREPSSCSERVLGDWSDDGRVDREYELTCYEEAIAALPLHIRDYTDAQETIERALAIAAGKATPARAERSVAPAVASVDPSGAKTLPLPLLAVFGVVLALLAAGALSYLVRRSALGRGKPRG